MPKALFFDVKLGKLVVDTIPVPTPGPENILVKVHAAALNSVDWRAQKYGIIFILADDPSHPRHRYFWKRRRNR